MRKTRLLLALAFAALLLSACGNKKQDDAQNKDEFLNTAAIGTAEELKIDGRRESQSARKHGSAGIEIPGKMKDTPEQILHRMAYTVSYNSTTKTPNWVAWHLTRDHASGSSQRNQEMFQEDHQVKNGPTNSDYYNSGFDRGHMCPAGDNKWDRKALLETFYFTNMCPQVHSLNAGGWNDLEIACRKWARKYGDVYIVCGPVPQRTPIRTIGRNKVWVPREFFKVVLCLRGEGSPKAIGFIYPNASASRKMFSYAMSVDEVERITGIDFFPQLDDNVEDRIEADRGYF